jgi:four helix bundle protein
MCRARFVGMPKISRFEDLIAWQFASELADLVDTLVSIGEANRNQSFRDQILKSSSKAPAQVAEGFLRYRPKESAFYYRIARASLGETKNHLRRGFHRKYWDEPVFQKAMQLAESAMKTTAGLLASRLAKIEEEKREQAEKKGKARPGEPSRSDPQRKPDRKIAQKL